jgi:integrase/recombinase XerD
LMGEKVLQGSPLLEVKSPKQPAHDLLRCLPSQFRKLTEALSKKASEGDEKAIRDLALTYVLGQCGLKASEAAKLTWADVLVERAGAAHQQTPKRGTLRVPTAKERLIPMSPEASAAVEDLRQLRTLLHLEISPHSPLFFGYLNVSRQARTPSLHRHGIKFVMYEVCEEILGIPYNSESLRNHAILRWLDQGLNFQQVADLAGYSSLHSLERFERAEKALRKPKRKKSDQRAHPNTEAP